MMLASSQILYAYVCEPDTLTKPYLSFLITHGGIRALQPSRAREYLDALGTAINSSIGLAQTASYNPNSNLSFAERIPKELPVDKIAAFEDALTRLPHRHVLCSLQHPFASSCPQTAAHIFYAEWFRALSMYGPLNAIMSLIFRGKRLLTNPINFIYNVSFSIMRSSLFLSCYVTMAWISVCFFRHLRGRDEKWMYYVNGLLSGSMVMFEVPGRRLELGLYCLPRAIESFWMSLVNHGYARHIP